MGRMASVELELRRFTVADVQAMGRAGVLRKEEHVELIDGLLVELSAQGPSHSALTVEVHRRLERLLDQVAHIRDHSNIVLGEHDMPEPDIALVRGEPLDYARRLPTGADLLLVIELSVTTHRHDRRKAELYGAHGIPEYWILDLPGRRVTVHRRPEPGGYADVEILGVGEEVPVPGMQVRWPVASLIPASLCGPHGEPL